MAYAWFMVERTIHGAAVNIWVSTTVATATQQS